MKAIVQDRYGSPEVLELQEIDQPAVGDDEVLVRVRAASVHADVWHVVRGFPYLLRLMGNGLRRPKHRVSPSPSCWSTAVATIRIWPGRLATMPWSLLSAGPPDAFFAFQQTSRITCVAATEAVSNCLGRRGTALR